MTKNTAVRQFQITSAGTRNRPRTVSTVTAESQYDATIAWADQFGPGRVIWHRGPHRFTIIVPNGPKVTATIAELP